MAARTAKTRHLRWSIWLVSMQKVKLSYIPWGCGSLSSSQWSAHSANIVRGMYWTRYLLRASPNTRYSKEVWLPFSMLEPLTRPSLNKEYMQGQDRAVQRRKMPAGKLDRCWWKQRLGTCPRRHIWRTGSLICTATLNEYVVNGSCYYGLVSNRTAIGNLLTYNCRSDCCPEKGGISKATHTEE